MMTYYEYVPLHASIFATKKKPAQVLALVLISFAKKRLVQAQHK